MRLPFWLSTSNRYCVDKAHACRAIDRLWPICHSNKFYVRRQFTRGAGRHSPDVGVFERVCSDDGVHTFKADSFAYKCTTRSQFKSEHAVLLTQCLTPRRKRWKSHRRPTLGAPPTSANYKLRRVVRVAIWPTICTSAGRRWRHWQALTFGEQTSPLWRAPPCTTC